MRQLFIKKEGALTQELGKSDEDQKTRSSLNLLFVFPFFLFGVSVAITGRGSDRMRGNAKRFIICQNKCELNTLNAKSSSIIN